LKCIFSWGWVIQAWTIVEFRFEFKGFSSSILWYEKKWLKICKKLTKLVVTLERNFPNIFGCKMHVEGNKTLVNNGWRGKVPNGKANSHLFSS
jgi:hypothetical protein